MVNAKANAVCTSVRRVYVRYLMIRVGPHAAANFRLNLRFAGVRVKKRYCCWPT
jgi:hypothetical protein